MNTSQMLVNLVKNMDYLLKHTSKSTNPQTKVFNCFFTKFWHIYRYFVCFSF